MTVVVNAVGIRMGGGVTVLRALAAALAHEAAGHRFVFYVSPELTDPGAVLPAQVEWRPTGAKHAGPLRRLWWDQVGLRRRLRAHRADVLLSFADYGQFFCPVPQLLNLQNALWFSDLYRDNFLPRQPLGFRMEYALRRWLVLRSVAAADRVLSPSATLLEMVERALPLPNGKASVNHHGTPPAAEPPARDYSGPIRLLFSAYYYDYKGFDTALEALQLLRRRHGPRFRLVTTADPGWGHDRPTAAARRDHTELEALRREDAVEVVGEVPYDRLLALYADCHVLCYPTRVESFGHPLVEAMACGLPVVASDIPVNRELAGEAALYFTPGRAEELAARLEEIVTQPERRAALVRRGRERAQTFSWTAHARGLVEALEALAAGKAGSR
jgi:glycosyltransferase involved in cell wall biosynthesis